MTYELPDYAAMLADPVRGEAYFSALRDTVKPGAVVADIGAGAGVLGVYAAMLGARRVFLIEPNLALGAALELARENGVADRVELIHDVSTAVTLPERADVIVSDLRGVIPLFGQHLSAAADMRERHLAPGGVCIPARDTLYAAIVSDADLHGKSVGAWTALPAPLEHASLDRLVANRWYRARATADQLLSAPQHWLTLDYDAPMPPLDGAFTTLAERGGVAHGLLLWFDAELTPSVRMSNAPAAPRALYGQAFFPFEQPIALEAGDELSGRLRAVSTGDEYEWTWSLDVCRGGTRVASARQASLLGIPILPRARERRSATFRPTLGTEGEVLRSALALADGSRDLGAIGAELHARHPGRFANEHEALRFAAQLDSLWG